jgi:SAM-dependent methyltransferase
VRQIDEIAIKAHSDLRFRSEYDYALFEYYRSAKVITFLERAGVPIAGRVLDAGCGGGGMPLSFAEETTSAVGIDLTPRFRDAGCRLARERAVRTCLRPCRPACCPSRPDLTSSCRTRSSSMATPDAFRSARRCCNPAAGCISTAHTVVCRRLPREGARAPHLLRAPRGVQDVPVRRPRLTSSSRRMKFLHQGGRQREKQDDLLERVRVGRLRAQIASAGLMPVREELQVTGTFRRAPAPIVRRLRDSLLTQDVVIGNVQYVLARA